MPYIGAPYNFVPFANRVYNPVPKEHMEDHDKIYKVEKVSFDANEEKRYAGEISYTITAESPIMIGDGKKHGDDKTEYFFKNENGKFAIPGSTMRGLIRGNVQILGASSVRRDIDDYRLMYRHVANGALKNEYADRLGNELVEIDIPGQEKKKTSISVLTNVKAGYISCNDNGEYEIIPTEKDSAALKMPMNYYVLSERKIAHAWMEYVAGEAGETFAYDLFVEADEQGGSRICKTTKLMNRPDCPFQMYIKSRKKQGAKNQEANGNKGSGREIWYTKVTDKKGNDQYNLSRTKLNGYEAGKLFSCNVEGKTFNELKTASGERLCVGDIHYKGTENTHYVPFALQCSYKVSKTNPRDIVAVSTEEKANTEGWEQGWAVSTGRMQEKKAIYIIPERDPDDNNKFTLDPQDIKSFRIDYNKRENALKSLFKDPEKWKKLTKKERDEEEKKLVGEARRVFGLPEKGDKARPVFYISLGGASSTYYIGFTPHLRLFFDHSVAEGIHEKNMFSNKYDLATSIFGFSEDKGSDHFKSKVSFSDAELTQPVDPQSSPEGEKETFILAEPKPSSYLDYLEQSDQLSTYSSDSFKLRGIKQYWMRKDIYRGNVNQNNENVGSKFIPLQKGTSFAGKIRFQNLTGEELGLLLWSIRLEPGCKMNVGKGKPYGFGVISISDLKTRYLNTEQAYNTDELTLDPLSDLSEEEQNSLIGKYKETVIGGKKVVEMASVKAFLRMKSEMPDPERIRYMSIDEREYQSRNSENLPLPTVDQTFDQNYNPTGVKAPELPQKENKSKVTKQPELKPIEKGSYIRVIIDSLEPDKHNPGKLRASFTEYSRIESGQENKKYKVEDGGAYKVEPDKKVGDEVRIKITKLTEVEADGSKTIKEIKGNRD